MSVGLLRDLGASPRPTGTEAIAAARQRVELELGDLGFDIREKSFEYSAFPGRFATPLFGAALAIIVGVAGHVGAAGQRWIPLLVCVLSTLALVLAARWVTTQGVLSMPLMRQRGVNLTATRLGALPRVWLCAHLDTKSQPVPTLLRMTGIVLESVGLGLTFALSVFAAVEVSMPPFFWAAGALVTLVGAVPVVLSVVGSNSPGALDNASGVATVIAAARALPDDSDVGILITDAEELGLAGARAWARGRPLIGGIVLNCDGVDDGGENVLMYTGTPPEPLIRAARRASKETHIPVVPRRMAFGLLTDSIAFVSEGLQSVTFSRGSYGSLARVHSRRDSLDRLRGTGIAEVAALIAATARHLPEDG